MANVSFQLNRSWHPDAAILPAEKPLPVQKALRFPLGSATRAKGSEPKARPRPTPSPAAPQASELFARLLKLRDFLDMQPYAGSLENRRLIQRRAQAQAEQILPRLASFPTLPLDGLYNLYILTAMGHSLMSPEGKLKALDILEKKLANPAGLKAMVHYLLLETTPRVPTEKDFIEDRVLPAVHNLLLLSQNEALIPTFPELLALAKKYPVLEGSVAVAAAVRGRRLEGSSQYPTEYEFSKRAELVLIVKRLSGHAEVKQRLLSLHAARHLPGAESYLPSYLQDPDESVRLAAYQALMERQAQPSLFLAGFEDPSLKIRVFCDKHMVESGSKEVLPLLALRLKEYVDNPADDAEISKLFVFVSADGSQQEPVSLKSLGLWALAKFGGAPPELWQGLLEKERDEKTLLWMAQTMEANLPKKPVILLLLNRLQKGGPDGLFIYTAQKIGGAKFKKAFPLVYQLVLLHDSPQVRRSALEAARAIQPYAVFPQLLKDSRHENPRVRAASAEALGVFPNPQALHRLFEMTQDPESSVQEEAARSLLELQSGKMEMAVDRILKKNPALLERMIALRGTPRPNYRKKEIPAVPPHVVPPPQDSAAPQSLAKILRSTAGNGPWTGKFGPYLLQVEILGEEEHPKLKIQAKKEEGEKEWTTVYFDDSCRKEQAEREFSAVTLSLRNGEIFVSRNPKITCAPLRKPPSPWRPAGPDSSTDGNTILLSGPRDSYGPKGSETFLSILSGFDWGKTEQGEKENSGFSLIPAEVKLHRVPFSIVSLMASPEIGWGRIGGGTTLRGRVGLSLTPKMFGMTSDSFLGGYSFLNGYFFAERNLKQGASSTGLGLDIWTSGAFFRRALPTNSALGRGQNLHRRVSLRLLLALSLPQRRRSGAWALLKNSPFDRFPLLAIFKKILESRGYLIWAEPAAILFRDNTGKIYALLPLPLSEKIS